MSPLLVFVVTWSALMFFFLTILLLDAAIESPIRTYLRHRGPQEECPKCHDTVPVGTLQRVAKSHTFAPNAFFASSIPRFDTHWEERGLITWGRSGTTCSECATMHPSSKRPPPAASF